MREGGEQFQGKYRNGKEREKKRKNTVIHLTRLLKTPLIKSAVSTEAVNINKRQTKIILDEKWGRSQGLVKQKQR